MPSGNLLSRRKRSWRANELVSRSTLQLVRLLSLLFLQLVLRPFLAGDIASPTGGKWQNCNIFLVTKFDNIEDLIGNVDSSELSLFSDTLICYLAAYGDCVFRLQNHLEWFLRKYTFKKLHFSLLFRPVLRIFA